MEPVVQRRSDPTATIPLRMSSRWAATVASRTGSASSPFRNHRPLTPTEKSPVIGLAPEWTPVMSWTSRPSPAWASSPAWSLSPGSKNTLWAEMPGVDLKDARAALPVDLAPSRAAEAVLCRKRWSTPSASSTFRVVGTPSSSKGVAPGPSRRRPSSTSPRPGAPTCSPSLSANRLRCFCTASADRPASSTPIRLGAAMRSNTTGTVRVGGLVAPSRRTARSAASAATGSMSRSSIERALSIPYPTCDSPFSVARAVEWLEGGGVGEDVARVLGRHLEVGPRLGEAPAQAVLAEVGGVGVAQPALAHDPDPHAGRGGGGEPLDLALDAGRLSGQPLDDLVQLDGHAAPPVPPTVMRAIRMVGAPLPTGTPWPSLPQMPSLTSQSLPSASIAAITLG